MLIRFMLENFFSVGKQQEFSMIGNSRANRLLSHTRAIENIGILRMASIYGANGSGKSNFIKSIGLLRQMIMKGEIHQGIKKTRSKTRNSDGKIDANQTAFIEFVSENKVFTYYLELIGERVAKETLCFSGLGKNSDERIFSRETKENGTSELQLSTKTELNPEVELLRKVIEKNLIKPNLIALKIIADLNNESLKPIKSAFSWFSKTLNIIYPTSAPVAITAMLQSNKKFHNFAAEAIRTLGLGVSRFEIQEVPLEDFLAEGNEFPDLKSIVADLNNNKSSAFSARTGSGAEVLIQNTDERITVKRVHFFHDNQSEENVLPFDLSEESDGTVRLFNLLPVIFNAVYKGAIFIVDEIERSIHPVLVKALFQWLSSIPSFSGQIIFTTHESNLLDQEIFRQDEIWFAEKKGDGNTCLYSLNDFKQHHTLDIRKGYLSGRYGAIPFLAEMNLEANL